MRWIINYIRSCFCKHNWELLSKIRYIDKKNIPTGHRWVYRCKKCGYIQRVDADDGWF